MIGAVVMVGRIAAGEIKEEPAPKSAAAELGSKARAFSLGKKKRTEIAKEAAAKRWRGS
jgi:hypothetical protein